MNTERKAQLAAQMRINPLHAIVLPAAITSMSRKLHLTESEFIRHCETNEPLRKYVAEICAKVFNAEFA